jgi:hypothetical protein
LTNHGEQVEKYYQILLVPDERIQISKASAFTEFRRLAQTRAGYKTLDEQLNQDEAIALALD